VAQECTNRFLACLVDGCSLRSPEAAKGMLELGLTLDWGMAARDMPLVAAALSRRLVEAADLGLFSSSSTDSPLGSQAGMLAHRMLHFRGAPAHLLGLEASLCFMRIRVIQIGLQDTFACVAILPSSLHCMCPVPPTHRHSCLLGKPPHGVYLLCVESKHFQADVTSLLCPYCPRHTPA
jgi:hypothetical protein